mgnify:CR=1 FL=1
MITTKQHKNLKASSSQMDKLCDKMSKQLVEIVKEHGNLIRTDNADIDYTTMCAYVEEDNRFVEKKILAVTTEGENLLVLVDEFNVVFGNETDEEILAYDGWYYTCGYGVLLSAPTLWNLCDYLHEYIDNEEDDNEF